jgi:hypothetical protein
MIWRETGAQDFGAKVAQGVQGGTVAQWHSTLSLRLNRRALVCNTSLRLNHVSIMSQSCLNHVSITSQSRSHVTAPPALPNPTNTKIPLFSISHYPARKLKWSKMVYSYARTL